MLRTFIFWLSLIFMLLTGLLLGPILALFLKKEEVYYRFSAIISKILLWLGRIKIEVSGLENLPKDENMILCSNHQSSVDIIVPLISLPVRFRYVIMRMIFNLPIFKYWVSYAGHIMVDMSDSRQAFLAMRHILSLLREGENIYIFPEGTRSFTGELQEFKDGASMLLLDAKKPVVPIAICGSIKVMQKSSQMVHPGHTIKFRIGKPLIFAELEDVNLENARRVSAELKAAIQSLMDESL